MGGGQGSSAGRDRSSATSLETPKDTKVPYGNVRRRRGLSHPGRRGSVCPPRGALDPPRLVSLDSDTTLVEVRASVPSPGAVTSGSKRRRRPCRRTGAPEPVNVPVCRWSSGRTVDGVSRVPGPTVFDTSRYRQGRKGEPSVALRLSETTGPPTPGPTQTGDRRVAEPESLQPRGTRLRGHGIRGDKETNHHSTFVEGEKKIDKHDTFQVLPETGE